MSDDRKIIPFSDGVIPRSKRKKVARKRTKRARDPEKQTSQHLQPRTAEDFANQETVERLALHVWATLAAKDALNAMSALVDEMIQSHLLDDDDEEADDGFDAHKKRGKEIFDEAIADALDRYPDFDSVSTSELPHEYPDFDSVSTSELPHDADPATSRDVEQLRDALKKCAIGATTFKERFSRTQLARMAKRALQRLFKRDPRYREHVREDVPGTDIRPYGDRRRTSTKGTFVKVEHEGLLALLTAGWIRVAKDRVDPVAWSHRFGFERKSERQSWRHHFLITERNGNNRSTFELPRELLAGGGASAIRSLMKAGIHVIGSDVAQKALVWFLRFKPRREIVRMPRAGWASVGSHCIFVRPDEVIIPPSMSQAHNVTYVLDATATRHGLHVAGTAAEWAAEIAAPLRGNSNVALSFATFFAAPLLRFASEPGGGNHLYGRSTIGKTMISDVGQSIYGWPHETSDNAFGVAWGGTAAGFDALALARTDLGLPLDEITLANPHTAEAVVYTVASGTKGPRATSSGHLRETAHASVLVLSTGEKSLGEFIGRALQEGARKRLVDVPAEVQPGSAFETIPREQIHIESTRLFDAMKRQHGAVGQDWQRHLVDIGPHKITIALHAHREAFLELPEVVIVVARAHPQVRAVANRFALLAAALRMAITAGLLPWTIKEADAGIAACMGRWVAQRGNVDVAGEVVRATRHVERELVSSLADRFIHIHRSGGKWTPVSEADAFRQQTPELFDGYAKPDRVLVRTEAWRRYCNGFDPSEIARHFQQRGALIADEGGVSKSEQVLGNKTRRFYVMVRAALTA